MFKYTREISCLLVTYVNERTGISGRYSPASPNNMTILFIDASQEENEFITFDQLAADAFKENT